MPRSRLFYTQAYKQVQDNIVGLLNSQPEFLTQRTAGSTRAAGDAIQDILSEHFQSLLGEFCTEYSADFTRRAMADLAFRDPEGCYYRVDVKTHRLDTQFNMPNLTSVERLSRFYEDDSNSFVVLMIRYRLEGNRVNATEAHFVPIEFLSWDCLTIGALGWGQLQIANANVINIREGYSRRRWMLELCDAILSFYPREIGKIGERIEYFKAVKDRWTNRPEA